MQLHTRVREGVQEQEKEDERSDQMGLWRQASQNR